MTAFTSAIGLVIIWLALGPYYGYSDTWMIAITVITDVVIFLMVFSIQNTQNRDSKAVRLKLNELITADKKARDTFIGLENLTDDELEALDSEFQLLVSKLEVHPAMHKLHNKITEAKAKRLSFSEQAEHIVDTVLNPFNGKHDDQ